MSIIDYINEDISKLFPIIGVAENSDGSIEVRFYDDATEEQKQQAYDIVNKMPLILAKRDKIAQINDDFESNTNQGWDSSQGFKLGLTTQDVSLLVGLFVLAKEGAVLGLEPPPIIDTDGNSHQLTMQELTMLMLQYGNARAELSKTYASRKKLVENATTIEELNNI